MKKIIALLVFASILLNGLPADAASPKIRLGNEVLMSKYRYLIEGKRIGLITNQSGVDTQGRSLIEILAEDKSTTLAALYGPEHGIDGLAKAGQYVESYNHPRLGIPVYSLYGATRMPTEKMLDGVDVLLFDIQDLGARSYTYMSTLNYAMIAAQKYQKPIIVLDRPNPVGGLIAEGPVLEDTYQSFVGVDNLPMAHGMTAGELAQFFNRKIGANLKVIPMEGYTRDMIYQDTGLAWVQTSPNIPDLDSVFGYMATGLGEGTGIFQADKFKWIGGKGIDAQKFADLLNRAGLPGVTFIPEYQGEAGGVRLNITDYYSFNPAKTGVYALAYAHSLNNFQVPKSGQTIVMFEKIMGTDKIGKWLEQGLLPQQIEANYTAELNRFQEERKKYLIYGAAPVQNLSEPNSGIAVVVRGMPVSFDTAPFLDKNDRLLVPLRSIVEALNASVHWNPEKQSITIVKSGKIILFTINSPLAQLNGEQKNMDTSPVIKNSRTMIPVRYVGEFLNAQVNWDQRTQTVFIE